MIPRTNYYASDLLRREVEGLFEPHFQFGALTTELENDRDFVCVDYHGASVVLQNFKGEIKAFQNVCTHRFNKIQTAERGNRPLTCSYHGWTFDKTGFPAGMPRRDGFRVDGDNTRLCLTSFEVETCGKFIFFRRAGNSGTLRDYLGRFFEPLQQISSSMGNEIDFGTIPHAANWKLLVENVLECYHCAVVHPDTFLKVLGVGRAKIEGVTMDRFHSSSHFPRTELKEEKRRQRALAYLDQREFAHNSFFHIYIFPNLFISSAEGVSFYVGHALPKSAGHTHLRFRLFEPRLALTKSQRASQDLVNAHGARLGREVIEQDRAILENVQLGLQLSDKEGIIGEEEVRIAAFMETYRRLMG